MTQAGARFVHLAGVCLVAAGQWDEALALLGDERSAQAAGFGTGCGQRASLLDCQVSKPNAARSGEAPPDGGIATAAALAVLRGRVYLGLENRAAAARCFKVR